jgi:hypothetical protein
MTPLRRRMIDDMTLHGSSSRRSRPTLRVSPASRGTSASHSPFWELPRSGRICFTSPTLGRFPLGLPGRLAR